MLRTERVTAYHPLPSPAGGIPVAEFTREASSMAEAVLSTIEVIESVMGEGTVIVVEPDLVSLTDIAELTGWSRQSIQQLAVGDRGEFDGPRRACES